MKMCHKRPSLLKKQVNYAGKMFYSTDPRISIALVLLDGSINPRKTSISCCIAYST